MPFVKGEKRPKNSGRKKGTPNKKTLLSVEEIALEYDEKINPLRFLYHLIGNKDIQTNLRFFAAAEILKYLYPKLKAIESKPSKLSNEELIEVFRKVIDKHET